MYPWASVVVIVLLLALLTYHATTGGWSGPASIDVLVEDIAR
jgi:hypothetical protein